MSPPMRTVLAVALLAYTVFLLAVLLNPSPAGPSELVTRVAALGVRLDLPAPLVVPVRVEFGLNVLAFLPLSLLGSLLRPAVTVSAWVTTGFAGSLLVEATQTLLPERSATHSDVVANTLGMALGAIAAWVASRVVDSGSPQASGQ